MLNLENTIAVEEGLNNINQALQSAGYRTVPLEDGQTNSVGAIVVSGQNQNFLGIHDAQSKIPVVNVNGKTAEEVVNMVKNRIR